MDKLVKAREIISDTDKEIAALFERRMAAVKEIAEYKKENALPILDASREEQLLRQNLEYIGNEALREYYISFMKCVTDISKEYQQRIIDS